MSLAQALVTALFGLFCIVLLALRLADARARRRALLSLPPNQSGGTPVMSTRRERWLAWLFCVFVAATAAWLALES